MFKKSRDKWKNDYFYDFELNKLSTAYIDKQKYNIPNNIINVLNRHFGNDWRKTKITHLHTIDYYNLNIINLININTYIDIFLISCLQKFNFNQVY